MHQAKGRAPGSGGCVREFSISAPVRRHPVLIANQVTTKYRLVPREKTSAGGPGNHPRGCPTQVSVASVGSCVNHRMSVARGKTPSND